MNASGESLDKHINEKAPVNGAFSLIRIFYQLPL